MVNLVCNDKHEYFYAGRRVVGVNEVLQAEGFISFEDVDPAVLEAARDFGTNFHKTLELHDKNDLVPLDPRHPKQAPLIAPLNGYKNFLASHHAEPVHIELGLFSSRFMFAGTFDRVYKIGGKYILVDLKSSRILQKATALQTGAYKLLVEENLGIRIRERWAVLIDLEGKVHIEPFTDTMDEHVFIGAVRCFYWKQKNLGVNKW